MEVTAKIDAGICGFFTQALASSEDGQNVLLQISSDCENINVLGEKLKAHGLFDAWQEISPAQESVVLKLVKQQLKGCCAGCAVPVGIFKAMQVAAGLALPKDISIQIKKDEALLHGE